MVRIYRKENLPAIYKVMGYAFNQNRATIDENIKRDHVNDNEIFFVDENEDKVITASVALITYDVNFNGNIVKFGGIAGVSSLPEYRDKGNIKNIMKYILNYMHENGYILSGLGPFAYEYYRKFGYEWAFFMKIVVLPLDMLKSFPKATKYVRFYREDSNITESFRNEFCKSLNGPLVRNSQVIKDTWDRYENTNSYVYGAYDGDKLVSYMVYNIQGKKIYVNEIYFDNELHRQYLLSFLYSHRSCCNEVELILTSDDEIRLIMPTPRFNVGAWANKAGRVVDVIKAFEMIKPAKITNQSFTIKINDECAPWNDGIYKVKVRDFLQATKLEHTKKADFEIDINRLSQLVYGFIDSNQAIKHNLVKINKYKPCFLYAFPKHETMLWQEF